LLLGGGLLIFCHCKRDMVVGGLYYGFEEVVVVERNMRGFKDEW
jgi:hypothetical protein